MKPSSRANALVTDYAGLRLNGGPSAPAADGAAAELVNLSPLRPGELAAREGYRPVVFDAEEE